MSPKKTVEGYVGGGLLTILLGPSYGFLLLQFPSILCPTGENQFNFFNLNLFFSFQGCILYNVFKNF